MTPAGSSSPHRVVVVGHGMVAARFVDDLVTMSAATGVAVEITVLGEEPHPAYNRLMLSEVVAGRARLDALQLPQHDGHVMVRTGVAVTSIDRLAHEVVDDGGERTAYDTLVLATGAAARMPFDRAGIHGVRALRTVDDCEELLAAAAQVDQVTVVGGGLLGIELACGLRARDVHVTLVHRSGHVMDRQLDAISGQVVQETLRRAGIQVVTDASVAELMASDGRLSGVRLSDGRRVPTGLLVVSAGAVPRDELARAAGLPVDQGVLVGDDLRSLGDPHIAAIGDCARTPSGWTGLLAPGWLQAAALASRIAGARSSEPPNRTDVVKLKAVGLSVVTLGALDPAHRVVQLSDASAGRCLTVAVHQGRVTGAICVGDPAVAADLTVAFERGSAIPLDPAHLLIQGVGPTATAAPSPQHMPAAATVCRCNGVTKKDIVGAITGGARDVAQVAARTRATTGCGGCRDAVCGLLAWMDEVDPPADGAASGGGADTDYEAHGVPAAL